MGTAGDAVVGNLERRPCKGSGALKICPRQTALAIVAAPILTTVSQDNMCRMSLLCHMSPGRQA